jgi:hypothetical protein
MMAGVAGWPCDGTDRAYFTGGMRHEKIQEEQIGNDEPENSG